MTRDATYKEQRKIALRLAKDHNRYRGDCPWCNRKDTFSVTEIGNAIIWKCYSAACYVSGKTVELSPASLQTIIDEKKSTSGRTTPTGVGINPLFDPYILPHHWQTVLPTHVKTYLKSVNSLVPVTQGWADVMFDPKEQRAVFLTRSTEKGKYIGATGRALFNNKTPKWKIYDKNKAPFTVPRCGHFNTKHAILVEDCPSACNVSNFADGVALLGTDLSDTTVDLLLNRKYEKISICLDFDAWDKALHMANLLRWYFNVGIISIDKDPKEYAPFELAELVDNFWKRPDKIGKFLDDKIPF